MIAFGTGAEESETAARLEWHRCGVRIAEDLPGAVELRRAVERVLGDPAHRRAAARIAAQAATTDAEAAIADLVESLARTDAEEAVGPVA